MRTTNIREGPRWGKGVPRTLKNKIKISIKVDCAGAVRQLWGGRKRIFIHRYSDQREGRGREYLERKVDEVGGSWSDGSRERQCGTGLQAGNG